MHTPTRVIVNGLAWLTGLIGFAWAFVGPTLMLVLLTGLLPWRRLDNLDTPIMAFLLGCTTVIAVLGGLLLRQVWRHRRQPDRNTARAIIRSVALIAGLSLFNYLRRHALVLDAGAWQSPNAALVLIGTLLFGYLCYRFALRRLADHAFPPAAADPRIN